MLFFKPLSTYLIFLNFLIAVGNAMKRQPWLLGLYIIVFCSTIIKSEDCEPANRRRKPGSASRRYQPRTTLCEECQPQHKNLLLLGVTAQEDRLKKCSQFEKIEGVSTLKSYLSESSPEETVLVLPSNEWIPESHILDIMVDRLGNVSVFTSGTSVGGGFYKHCHNLGPKCFLLENLIPVISQIEIMNTHSKSTEEDVKKALLELYNARWKDGEDNVTSIRHRYPPVHRQIDQLIQELCKREQVNYRMVQILRSPSEIVRAKKMKEDESPYPPETSLAINDILPINPKNYDKNRPPKMAGHPTIVYFHVTVLSLDSINEESMTYVADIFLAQSWRDSRLRLPENMTEEYRILDVEWLKHIWRPDCFFKNAKKVTFHEMSIPNHYLWLYHDKTLLYMAKLTLVLSCAMKFESYPHDTQICSMMIESLSHTTHDLVFIWNITDPLVVNPEIELPQLDISNNYTTDCTLTYSTGNFTCLAVVFTLRRRLGYHLFHTYIPSALIVVMSWISFWIKPEAIPARVTLGVTSLLTLATQNTQSQQNLPPVSYVKAIDVWMSSCSVFVFLSLMEFAVVNNYMGPVATKAMKGYSEDDLRSAIDDYRDLSLRSRAQVTASVHTVPQYDTCYGKSTALLIDKFSRFFFPFSFFILNVVYWSTFL